MKIVTYNVNGLRPRIAQFGSLQKLLSSLDADIICFQETKLAKQDLREELVRAEGYESFFSCTRAYDKGRSGGYSGVATFCKVKSAFSSHEVALPLAAEEGFTGLLDTSRGNGSKHDERSSVEEALEEFSRDELLKVDGEGRCVITDHGHFVLFNVYGPRADSDDTERIQFKRTFFNTLQRRWESLLHKGRRIMVVGDFNIAPAAIDRCDAGPDFENNEFRKWFRSLLMENGGQFFDVFRAKHPERRDAYTCWSTSSGAEVFNFGSRIDHILSTRSCLHEDKNESDHNFLTCHVKGCDILVQFKRWKSGNELLGPRWKEGRSIKLEGSDHAPVFISLVEMPNVPEHSTPSLSSRYYPQIYGNQQTLVSMLMKRKSTERGKQHEGSDFVADKNLSLQICTQLEGRQSFYWNSSPSNTPSEHFVSKNDDISLSSNDVTSDSRILPLEHNDSRAVSCVRTKKKARRGQLSQLSLKSFFQINSKGAVNGGSTIGNDRATQSDASTPCCEPNEAASFGEISSLEERQLCKSASMQDEDELDAYQSSSIKENAHQSSSTEEKRSFALMEWRRIQQLMQSSIPLCKGHNEPCVARTVKKAGPNFGRRFYVCNRGEGPASNPEANCGYFKWATSKSKQEG